MKAVARVDDAVAAEGEFTFALVDREATLNEADSVVETRKRRVSKEQMHTTDTKTEIHSTALVDPSAQLGRGVKIGAYCVIGGNVSIGDGARIDYILPSTDLEIVAGGVFWPTPEEDPEGARWADEASDHRLVWLDVALGDDGV